MYAERTGFVVAFVDALPSLLTHASRCRFGRTVETVITTIGQAFEEGATTLTRLHFAQEWRPQEGCDWDANVFVVADWAGPPITFVSSFLYFNGLRRDVLYASLM